MSPITSIAVDPQPADTKMGARCYKLACLAACAVFFCSAALAGDQGVNGYSATTAQSPVQRGCVRVLFVCNAFSGTIGNATLATFTGVIPISAVGDNQRLGSFPYTVTSGANTLVIIEIK